MLEPDQAAALHALVIRELKFDADGNVVEAPTGDLAAIADALAALEAARDGDDLRARVADFLQAMLERELNYEDALLRALALAPDLGVKTGMPLRTGIARGGVLLEFGGVEYWPTRELIDALFRIANVVAQPGEPNVWTPPMLAWTVEQLASQGKRAAEIVGEVSALLAALGVPGCVDISVHVIQSTAKQVVARKLSLEPPARRPVALTVDTSLCSFEDAAAAAIELRGRFDVVVFCHEGIGVELPADATVSQVEGLWRVSQGEMAVVRMLMGSPPEAEG